MVMEKLFRKYYYTETQQNKEVKCVCGWIGKRSACNENWVDTIRPLTGWRGMEFVCPKCNKTIDRIIMARS